MRKRTTLRIVLGCLSFGSASAIGGQTVAVIDYSAGWGAFWCPFLEANSHPCTLFPSGGPTGPLDPYDVIIDMSDVWADPDGLLADAMQAGKTVITWGEAPLALGINSNPTVQAWIGANQYSGGTEELVTTMSDPLLGEIPPGTEIWDANTSFRSGVRDSSGYPQAQSLAIWTYHALPDPKPIGILRNFWGNGASVYLFDGINPGGNELRNQIVLNSVRIQQLIPATSTWGLLIFVLGVATAGTLVLRRRGVFQYQVA